ncbi:uncharacterized protein LOC130452479 [Diorhabda sublineata]|uniref:uncharacterized protein LOC130452479 n=1 Tax=Diorhabda sublineata TaxID=1163346 RepID=UPI0024E04FDC|nr:uncharacterized protein LOC130452479 [Diorhabda sublineata]
MNTLTVLLSLSSLLFQLTFGKSLQLPDYLQKYSCVKSDPDYEKCILEGFLATKPFFLEGIPELNVPSMDPYKVDAFAVNSSVENLIKIDAVCRNAVVTGLSTTIIDYLKADPIKHYGEIKLTIPWMYAEMDYDVKGQLLVIPLESRGHFQGNFTDTKAQIKGSLKMYTKDGVDYFKVNKLALKVRIGDGYVKLTSKDKELQYAADLISNFFNENPRQVLDAINPLFIQYAEVYARKEMDRILATVPASAWLPE